MTTNNTTPLTTAVTDATIGTVDEYVFTPTAEGLMKAIRATISSLKMLGKLAGLDIEVTIRGAKE